MVSKAEIRKLEAEVVRSRAVLARRWSGLENNVSTLVHSATVEVSETVQQAKEAVSITHHVETRPWQMVGGAVLAGLALSRFTGFQGLVGLGLATAMSKGMLPDGDGSPLRARAVSSLSDVARGFVHRKVPSQFAPFIDQMISRAAESLSTPKVRSGEPNREINGRGESVTV